MSNNDSVKSCNRGKTFVQPELTVLDVKRTKTGAFDVNETAMIIGPTTS